MINAIVVDDERKLGDELKRTLESFHSDIKVASVCYSVKEAEDAIYKFHPDLVFMDVELSKGQTSFDLLNKISPINFEIIFTTAYNQYAIQAIKFSAIDYLLKPIEEEELKQAIHRFKSKKSKVDAGKVESLLSAWANPGNQQNKMPLPISEGYELIVIADIIYCNSSAGQTQMVLTGNRELIIKLSLMECETLLKRYRFFRIHHSHLINLNHIKKYIKGKDGVVVLTNDVSLSVSRNFKEKFIERLKAS